MDCPRCGAPDPTGPECPQCGVILAKARQPRGRGVRFPAARQPPPSSRTSNLVLLVVGLVAVGWAAWRVVAPGPTPPEAPADPPPEAQGAAQTAVAPPTLPDPPAALPPPPPAPPSEPLVLSAPAQQAATVAADQAAADRLGSLLATGQPIRPGDLQQAQELYDRYGAKVAPLLEAVLVNAAIQQQRARQYDQADTLLRRAAEAAPGSVHPLKAHVALLAETGDWSGVEVSARAALGLSPSDPALVQALAQSLVKRDRSRDAIEALEDFLDRYDDAATRGWLQRIRSDQATEDGLREQRVAHFHVRYDGDTHEAVGREVLRVLDRHYATLVRQFDHRPTAPIPVILLSRESYYADTGAPAWSGGRYDSFDGRVRLPIGGLSASLTPEIDDTLLHELTHAFVNDISRGVAPRELHEGLAQMAEGKRIEELLSRDELEALAEGRIRGPGGFYMASLSFTQYLVAQRGQGGINDLLEAMAETGSVGAAFERVYRRDLASLQREWQTRMEHQYAR